MTTKMLSYEEKFTQLAEDFWAPMNKGPLLDGKGEAIKQTGLSSGEHIIWQAAMAIAFPQTERLPLLYDLAGRVSDIHQVRFIRTLALMLAYRC